MREKLLFCFWQKRIGGYIMGGETDGIGTPECSEGVPTGNSGAQALIKVSKETIRILISVAEDESHYSTEEKYEIASPLRARNDRMLR